MAYAFSYDYDLNGNRTSGKILGVATHWAYNVADELTQRWTVTALGTRGHAASIP